MTKISGGTLTLAHSLALQNSTIDYSDATGMLSFGNLTAAALGGLKGNQNLSLSNASSEGVALSLGKNDLTNTFSGALTGPGGLTKIGAGTQALAGSNSYTGTTSVSGGTLLINGSHTGGAAYTIGTGGALGGSGTIDAPVTVNMGGALAGGQTLNP